MKPPGHFKIRYQRSGSGSSPTLQPRAGDDPVETVLGRVHDSERRVQRIVASLREEIIGGEDEPLLRVRRIFTTPREIYRLEIERPEIGYQRITLLDRDTLECLLEADDVRDAFELALSA